MASSPSLNKYVVLSSNEATELLRKQREDKRIARLLETRKQARLHAARVREEFRKKKEEDQDRKFNILKNAWQEAKDGEIMQMKQELDSVRKDVGTAFLDANQVKKKDYEQSLFKQQVMHVVERRQNARFKHALDRKRYGEYEQQEPKLRKQEALSQIRHYEDERAKSKVRKQRKSELLHEREQNNYKKTIDSTLFNDIDRIARMKAKGLLEKEYEEREREKLVHDYSKSYFHMNPTEPDLTAGAFGPVQESKQVNAHVVRHVGAPAHESANAIDAARVENARNRIRIEKEAQKRRKQVNDAHKRAQIALDKVHAQQDYAQITDEMEKLAIADRRAKVADLPKKFITSISDRKLKAKRAALAERQFEYEFLSGEGLQKQREMERRLTRQFTPKELQVLYDAEASDSTAKPTAYMHSTKAKEKVRTAALLTNCLLTQ